MLATLRAIAGRHGLATALAAVCAATVAGLGGGYALGAHGATAAVVTQPLPTEPAGPPSPDPQGNAGKHTKGAGALMGLITLTARQTGQSVQDVVASLRQGRSLDDIAGAASSAVEQAALAAAKTRLDAQVSAGKLTADQETKRLDALKTQIGKVMAEPGSQLVAQLPSGGAGTAVAPSPSPGP